MSIACEAIRELEAFSTLNDLFEFFSFFPFESSKDATEKSKRSIHVNPDPGLITDAADVCHFCARGRREATCVDFASRNDEYVDRVRLAYLFSQAPKIDCEWIEGARY
jgi:hypothetical protein